MLRTFPTINALAAAAVILSMGAVQAQERTVYRCTTATGAIVFSDTECMGNGGKLNLKSLSEEELAKRKAERDANNARDANLANQVQANRLSNEQAARAAQDQQVQLNKSISDKFEQERNQKNATVVSAPNVSQSAPITTAP